jgi:hypothetical protein
MVTCRIGITGKSLKCIKQINEYICAHLHNKYIESGASIITRFETETLPFDGDSLEKLGDKNFKLDIVILCVDINDRDMDDAEINLSMHMALGASALISAIRTDNSIPAIKNNDLINELENLREILSIKKMPIVTLNSDKEESFNDLSNTVIDLTENTILKAGDLRFRAVEEKEKVRISSKQMDISFFLIEEAEDLLKDHFKADIKINEITQPAEVTLIMWNRLSPGSGCFAKVNLCTEADIARHDHLLLISPETMEIFGVGLVLDPYPAPHNTKSSETLAWMQLLMSGEREHLCRYMINHPGRSPLDITTACARLNWTEEKLRDYTRDNPRIYTWPENSHQYLVTPQKLRHWNNYLLKQISNSGKDSGKKWSPRSLEEKFPEFINETIIEAILEPSFSSGLLEKENDFIKSVSKGNGNDVSDDNKILNRLTKIIMENGLNPISLRNLKQITNLDYDSLKTGLKLLKQHKTITYIDRESFLSSSHLLNARSDLQKLIDAGEKITPEIFAGIFGISSMNAKQIMAYFKKTNIKVYPGNRQKAPNYIPERKAGHV